MNEVIANPGLVANQFDVAGYLSSRIENDGFVMVEMGHDALPVDQIQPFEFTGRRLYVGMEAWLRDGCNKHLALLQQKPDRTAGSNVVFMRHDVGVEVQRDEEGSWLSGEYSPETVLPAGMADELFIGNVFGDPHIAYYTDRSKRLMAEAGRIISDSGFIVIRESITPQRAQRALTEENIESVGLQLLKKVAIDTLEWEALQVVYAAEKLNRYYYRDESAYYFIGKPTT